MNNQSLLHQIIVDKPLSPIRLRADMRDLQFNGVLPFDINEFSVHISESSEDDEKREIHYDIYPRFNNIIEVTL